MSPELPGGTRPLGQRSVPSYLRKAVKAARKAGWAVGLDGRGHIAFYGPQGQRAVVAQSTHACGHTVKNYMLRLRRAGVPGV